MDIRVKEPIYINCKGQEYVIRPGTIGVDKNKVVYFYEVTRSSSVGFSRDFCMENPQIFLVSRTLSDKEVSQRDVFKILDEYNRKECTLSDVYERIKSL